jgi:hypothetical protein
MGNHGINGNGEMFTGFCAYQELLEELCLYIKKNLTLKIK